MKLLSPNNSIAIFSLGFRPFFLLGALSGLGIIGYFALCISGFAIFPASSWDAITWHRHEMIFGYSAAIIAGFLFTAVPNWTGRPTPKGVPLAIIVLLWLAGRAALLMTQYIPAWLIAAIDTSFLIICAAGIAPALIKSANKRNYFFILLLIILAFSNLLSHSEDSVIADYGIKIGLDIIIIIMVIMGGRVIPFFTERWLSINIIRNRNVEILVIATTIAALVFTAIDINSILAAILCLSASIANGWRLLQWQSSKTIKTPLLWILHSGYAWLVIGFFLKAVFYGGLDIPPSLATHAFTTGGIGALTLGMMARVSLGHSGRQLIVGNSMMIAFVCINIAAILRVFGVGFFPAETSFIISSSAIFWLAAFGIFVVVYAPILLKPREDERN